MPAMFSSNSYISTSIQQSVEDPLHLSYEDDEEEGEDEDIADDRSDSSWTNGKDIFQTVLQIFDILIRFRIRGLVPLTNGSGVRLRIRLRIQN
jgi:hypothetical protein